jgi:hypothetical protein
VACRDGVCDCAAAIDGADCGGGRQCLNGGCGAPPTCKGNTDPELCSADAECCSQHCLGSLCLCSLAGKPCHSDFDCCLVDGLRCVGFVCTETA